MGLRGCVPFTRHIARRHSPLLDWPDWHSGFPIERVDERLFRHLHQCAHRPTVDVEITEDWPCRDVPVPDVVMNQLVMPDSFPRLEIESDNAVREQVVAGPVPPVDVSSRRLHWN